MLVVDSSAVVAMMFGEAGADDLAQRLAAEPHGGRVISAVNYVEAGTGKVLPTSMLFSRTAVSR